MPPVVGLRSTLEHVVAPEDTAQAVGSGDVPVLATPRLLALAEAATVAALDGSLAPGETSVGTRVHLEHTQALAVGAALKVRAVTVHVDGRLVRFDVLAEDVDGVPVGHGQITRVVVDRERFLSRVPRP